MPSMYHLTQAAEACSVEHGHLQRGVTEAQNGFGFGMLPGAWSQWEHGLSDGYLFSLALDGSHSRLFTAPEL